MCSKRKFLVKKQPPSGQQLYLSTVGTQLQIRDRVSELYRETMRFCEVVVAFQAKVEALFAVGSFVDCVRTDRVQKDKREVAHRMSHENETGELIMRKCFGLVRNILCKSVRCNELIHDIACFIVCRQYFLLAE